MHGERLAAEMEAVAKMLADIGLPGYMTTSTVKWQRRLATSAVGIPQGEKKPDHEWFADATLERFGIAPRQASRCPSVRASHDGDWQEGSFLPIAKQISSLASERFVLETMRAD